MFTLWLAVRALNQISKGILQVNPLEFKQANTILNNKSFKWIPHIMALMSLHSHKPVQYHDTWKNNSVKATY